MSPPGLQFRHRELLGRISFCLLNQWKHFLGIDDSGPEGDGDAEDEKIRVDSAEPEKGEDICFVVERFDESDQDEYGKKNDEDGQVKQEALEHDNFNLPHHEALDISHCKPSLPGGESVDTGEETARN